MKSIRGVVEAKCPHCQAPEFEAEIWSFIRADSEPELKEAVLYGELNLLECPECKNFFYFESPVVYFDPQIELLVFLLPHSYEKEAVMWREKMASDFASIKQGLASELK
ncbi:MAG TPA: CpXC domain-containing protein, partial [Elusimicrobiales bacterium]|nr:CpXC domain-containing protein [Elusimicrobiales bacterium]